MVAVKHTFRRRSQGFPNPFLLLCVPSVALMMIHLFKHGFLLLEDQSTLTLDSLTSLRASVTEDQQCRYYLAESAIPKGGLGLFTAVDIPEGAQAQPMPDICIYVADTPSGTDFHTHSWAKDVFFGQFEGKKPRAACEGFATLFNTMPDGVKTSELLPMKMKTNAGLDRHHPGAGAITHYYGITSKALKDVKAGSELTIDYGDWHYSSSKEYKAPVRTPEWLQTHGMCIDNIQIQPADPEMGRGAFASRNLRKGDVVAPVPLQMYKHRSDFAQQEPEALFVNYCFQPKGSDMMLFPYGPGVNLINHSSKKPNVYIRWSRSNLHHHHWLSLSIEQMWEMVYPGGLMLEVVALRDLKPGEELFMDYGDEWEKAWEKHVAEWKSPANADEYVYPADMDYSKPFRTLTEQKKNPYPKNLHTVCWTNDWYKPGEKKWKQPKWEWPMAQTYCHILKRNKRNDTYTVALTFKTTEFDPDGPKKKMYINTDVPKSAITFAELPYQSDMHIKNAFRHPIVFPDHLVPDAWRTEFEEE